MSKNLTLAFPFPFEVSIPPVVTGSVTYFVYLETTAHKHLLPQRGETLNSHLDLEIS